MERKAQHDRLTQRLADEISRAETIDAAVDILAEGLTRLLGASGGTAIMFVDPTTQRLHGRIGKPDELWPDVGKISISLDDPSSWAASAVTTGTPIAIDNTEREAGGKKWLIRLYGHRSLLFIPITAGHQALGCAVVAERDRFRHFTEHEVGQAMFLTSKAGEAIKRLRP